MFEFNSRYYAIETIKTTLADGRVVAYKRRRFCPPGDSLATLSEVVVSQGERLDVITARSLGDPEQFWQVCDANDALDPEELTAETGRQLRIPIPQAPGASNA
jgi:hypothetical protein